MMPGSGLAKWVRQNLRRLQRTLRKTQFDAVTEIVAAPVWL